MNWNGNGDFWAMGGYGLYVWGSYGVAALAMLLEPLLVARRLWRARRDLDATDEME